MSALDNLVDLQEQICYVNCGFCSTILLVSVPCSSLSMVVSVRCGHCSSILSVNMMIASLFPLNIISSINQKEQMPNFEASYEKRPTDKTFADTYSNSLCFSFDEDDEDCYQVIHKPSENKQRAPSAYNHFIKREIKRLKMENPEMTHKQAFSAAAKNWAYYPQDQYNCGGDYGCVEENIKMDTPSYLDNEEHLLAMASAEQRRRDNLFSPIPLSTEGLNLRGQLVEYCGFNLV